MKRVSLIYFVLLATLVTTASYGQGKALTFEEAEKHGIPFQLLDSTYKSALHSNKDLAVFKSPEEQAKLHQAYAKLLQDIGAFLKENGFTWGKQVRGMNRIYFKPDGSIDYFLYHFPESELAGEKEKTFARLLTLFVQQYKLSITADEKFAQCSPVKYQDI